MLMRPLRLRGVGRSFRSIILLAVAASLVLALIASSLLIWPIWASYRYTNEVVALDGQLGEITVALARERGLVATALGADGPASGELLADIEAARRIADTGLGRTLLSLARSDAATSLKGRLQKIQLLRGTMVRLRQDSDAALRRPAGERDSELMAAWIAASTDLIEACQDMRLAAMRSTRTVDTTFEDLQMLQHFAWSAAEHAGRERAMLGAFISAGRAIDPASLQELQQNRGELTFAWGMAMLLADVNSATPELQSAARSAAGRFFVEYEKLRGDVIEAGHHGRPYPTDASGWFTASTAAIDSLLAVERESREAATRYRNRNFHQALGAIAGGAGLFVVLTGAASASISLFKRRISGPLNQITEATRRFARGDYGATLPDVLPGTEVARIAAAVVEFRDDAAERARLESELRIARDRAEAASRAKSQFLANVSHELRTPLNAIIGFSELIKTQALGPLGHEKYLEYAGDVYESGRHLLDVINDVLDMARIETQQSTLHEDVVDLAEIAALGIRRVEAGACLKGLTLEREGAGCLRVLADPVKLDRLVANLLSNAVKFTGAGGRITLRIYRDLDRGAVLEVEDTGIGMSASDIAMAYEPFCQADSGLNRRHGGTGLGIPLSNAIAELHGGRLEIESEPGVGTTVRLSLPPQRCLE